MSFSEPERDDGNLPPVNVVIPDDARELARDVLAYRREVRARRRRQRLLRILRPFRVDELAGHAVIIPLIAACLAISLIGGALLSVATMSPASAPTLSSPLLSPRAVTTPTGLSPLPAGTVQVGGRDVPARSLVAAAIALVPAGCGCGPELLRLARQAVAANAGLYFAATGAAIPQLAALTISYGDGRAIPVTDSARVLSDAFHPAGLTVLLVFEDADAETLRNLSGDFQLTPVLRELKLAGASLSKA